MKKFYITFVIVVIGLAFFMFHMKNKSAQPASLEQMPQTSGLHIMKDGTVMDGTGQAVQNATIQSDGNIRLEDGRVFIPMMDMRK